MGTQRGKVTPLNTHNETNSESRRAENPCATSIFTKRIRSIVSIPMVSKLSTLFGAPEGTRTPGLLIRSQFLHSIYRNKLHCIVALCLSRCVEMHPCCSQKVVRHFLQNPSTALPSCLKNTHPGVMPSGDCQMLPDVCIYLPLSRSWHVQEAAVRCAGRSLRGRG